MEHIQHGERSGSRRWHLLGEEPVTQDRRWQIRRSCWYLQRLPASDSVSISANRSANGRSGILPSTPPERGAQRLPCLPHTSPAGPHPSSGGGPVALASRAVEPQGGRRSGWAGWGVPTWAHGPLVRRMAGRRNGGGWCGGAGAARRRESDNDRLRRRLRGRVDRPCSSPTLFGYGNAGKNVKA